MKKSKSILFLWVDDMLPRHGGCLSGLFTPRLNHNGESMI
jgi:hypothetical protein